MVTQFICKNRARYPGGAAGVGPAAAVVFPRGEGGVFSCRFRAVSGRLPRG
ncbi:MAG: hypothetical protein KAT34_00085 [Candidatus Aminicenantes bacterium]|nr:hypothetical protein [Candidatus Aminicenantes bacterium]